MHFNLLLYFCSNRLSRLLSGEVRDTDSILRRFSEDTMAPTCNEKALKEEVIM